MMSVLHIGVNGLNVNSWSKSKNRIYGLYSQCGDNDNKLWFSLVWGGH